MNYLTILLIALFVIGCSANKVVPTKQVEVSYMPSGGWPSGKPLPTKVVDKPYQHSEGACADGTTPENASCH